MINTANAAGNGPADPKEADAPPPALGEGEAAEADLEKFNALNDAWDKLDYNNERRHRSHREWSASPPPGDRIDGDGLLDGLFRSWEGFMQGIGDPSLFGALSLLTDEQRELLWLVEVKGFTAKEIAASKNISEVAVRQRKCRLIKDAHRMMESIGAPPR